jgi:hypothetical protein
MAAGASSKTTLEAWAIPVVGAAGPDHTYVVSSDGLRWGCHGRSAGGSMLRSSIGSSAIAACLARSNGLADIRYGRSGVCHQIANRILVPAGITVQGCGGYIASVAFWGEYGKGAWPGLRACFGGATLLLAGAGAGSGGSPGNVSGSPDVYPIPQSSMERTHVTEFLALAENALGSRLDEGTRRSLRRIQRDFSRRQTQLVRVLDLEAMPPEEYLGQLNALMKATLAQMEMVLGKERFNVVFGDAGRHPERLVDRDAFMGAIAAERASAR